MYWSCFGQQKHPVSYHLLILLQHSHSNSLHNGTPDCIRCASRRRSPAGRANDISTPHIIWRWKNNLFPRRRSCGVKNFDIIVNYKLIHDSLRGICNLGNFQRKFRES